MKTEIVKLLMKKEEYVSGEDLSAELGVSRAAVWKHIKAIQQDGGVIDAVTNKGYKLLKLPDLLKSAYVNAYTKEPRTIEWYAQTDSTNTTAKNLARGGAVDKTVVVTEYQTAGKGRLGRNWLSKKGEAIMLSCVLRPDISPADAPPITFAVALGVAAAMKQECGIEAKIKWPNDVVYGQKKLCGILTELSGDFDKVEYIVCGMGINVNQTVFEEEVASRAVSLKMLSGKTINRVHLCAKMIDYVFDYCDKYIKEGIQSIKDEYCKKSVIINEEVAVICAEQKICGVCCGFGDAGELLLRTDNGEIKTFHAGEVSVRSAKTYQ